jgi:putative phosphonate catabolism associated alcohol dehydrogenase
VVLATVCGSDLHSRHGRRPSPVPGILGHEMVGVIDEVDGDVLDLRGHPLTPGDRVTWTEYVSCGRCPPCARWELPQKCRHLRKYGHEPLVDGGDLLGGFAERCHLVPGTGILRVPPEVSDDEAAPVNCGAATMVAATEAAGIALGASVVVQGLGLLGLYGVALARARGATTVLGIDPVETRRTLAVSFGATTVLDPGALAPRDLVVEVRRAAGGDGAETVIETSGAPGVVSEGLSMLRVGGRYVLAGLVHAAARVELDGSLIVKQAARLVGVHNYHPRHLVEAMEFVREARRRLPLGALIRRFPLERIEAHGRATAVR